METEERRPESAAYTPRPIRLFIIKTAIVAIATILVVSYLDNLVQQRVAQIQGTKIGGREFWGKLERELENQADPKSDLSPEKKKKIMAEIRIIADRWRPILSELNSALNGGAAEKAK